MIWKLVKMPGNDFGKNKRNEKKKNPGSLSLSWSSNLWTFSFSTVNIQKIRRQTMNRYKG